MSNSGSVIFLIGFVAAVIFTFIVPRKVAQNIYVKTGYYGFGTAQRALCAFILILPVALSLVGKGSPEPSFRAVAPALIPIAILVLMNLKAKNPVYIIVLTVLQIIYGIVWILFVILKFGLSLVFHSSLNFDWGITEQMQAQFQAQTAQQQKQEWEKLERAEVYAQKQGFRDADEAELFGIDTGKKH